MRFWYVIRNEAFAQSYANDCQTYLQPTISKCINHIHLSQKWLFALPNGLFRKLKRHLLHAEITHSARP